MFPAHYVSPRLSLAAPESRCTRVSPRLSLAAPKCRRARLSRRPSLTAPESRRGRISPHPSLAAIHLNFGSPIGCPRKPPSVHNQGDIRNDPFAIPGGTQYIVILSGLRDGHHLYLSLPHDVPPPALRSRLENGTAWMPCAGCWTLGRRLLPCWRPRLAAACRQAPPLLRPHVSPPKPWLPFALPLSEVDLGTGPPGCPVRVAGRSDAAFFRAGVRVWLPPAGWPPLFCNPAPKPWLPFAVPFAARV